ncbi:MAG TPA: redoxin domain-containing protein [Candidatus Dormibacteraeota bacterium]|nr:redoxin domain-containing protein [Candidatus Dormibacteraeota bacterium]
MSWLLRPWRLAVLLVLVLLVGLGVSIGLLARHSSPPQGRLLVLLTVDSPLPAHPASLQAAAVGLRLLPTASGSSWVKVAVRPTSVTLPGPWAAPSTDTLFLESVPVGSYRAAELELQTSSGQSLDNPQNLVLKVAQTGLTPLLFTFKSLPASTSGGASRVNQVSAYGGNDQVNFGLEVAQGKVMSLPNLPLENQSGQAVSLSSYRGKVVILASFLTECQETCPLVAAALLQLQRQLDQEHLQGEVQIVEVSQDPRDDTPAILTQYRRRFSLPWPLLTGTATNVGQFWTGLKVPPIQQVAWTGPAPTDVFTGQVEPYNLVHASVVDVVDQEGYIVSQFESQPTITASAIPATIYRYLDAQGRQQQRAGGSWTAQSLLADVTPLLQQTGSYTTLPQSGGVVTVGAPAPDFSLASSAGGYVALSAQLGHPVLIDFWATWCTNCKADMRLVAATAAHYRAQGLHLLLVDFQESRTTAVKFLKGLGIDLPTLLDRNGQVAQRYGVPGLPVAVFIDSKGEVTGIQLGQLSQAEVNADMPAALAS